MAEAKQSILDNTDRMAQFTELMTDIVGKAIAANNESLSKTISEDVGETGAQGDELSDAGAGGTGRGTFPAVG